MYVPWAAAWAAHARKLNQVCVMPCMMTLLDWAKSQGASDLDAGRVERIIAWSTQLRNTPHLLEWLAGSDDVDVFAVAAAMVELSDELSLRFLAGEDLGSGEKSLRAVVDEVYEAQARFLARQELDVLLQCWRADVAQQTPVVRYLATLAELIKNPSVTQVSVVRNRTWSHHESWFWHSCARVFDVTIFDITQIRAQRTNDVVRIKQAWIAAHDRVVEPLLEGKSVESGVVYAAPHLEDEAQAIVQQVLAWRAAGLQKIALVALDRTVSRRVWALLHRRGVDIRDDTGWLLSTSRAASSWQQGFELWSGDVYAPQLLDWLSHPLVLANVTPECKNILVSHIKELAYGSKNVLCDWRGWLNIARQNECVDIEVQTLIIDMLQKALVYTRAFAATQSIIQWVDTVCSWATDFGMLSAWQDDPAGKVWLQLLESWRGVEDSTPLSMSAFVRIVQSEVEQATFRPHDVKDEVLLLPLGSTRMRDFDAVWLMGADAGNLPNTAVNSGLLNVSARQALGLPTYLDQQIQAQHDLIDLFARTPIVFASYCTTKEGAPNAPSTWLMQWLRAVKAEPTPVPLNVQTLQPQVVRRSQAAVADCVPTVISATDLAVLAACPYQFYTRKVLNLKSKGFVTDAVEAVDKGNLWHRIVVDFHERRAKQLESSRDSDLAELNASIEKHLQRLCQSNARYWVVREVFLTYVESYVDWWRGRAQEGWRVAQSEEWMTQAIDAVQWQGKIDQIDVREYLDEGTGEIKAEYAVMDYKTGSVKKYQKDIIQQSDIQLAFYINLFDEKKRAGLIQAGYIGVTDEAIKPKKVKPHLGDTSYPQAWLNASQYSHDAAALNTAAQMLQQQVMQNFKAMREGQPLVAMGELSACQYCAVRGLCRKGYTVIAEEL
jgi:ATP-dependent helicase/nuclease subunit B